MNAESKTCPCCQQTEVEEFDYGICKICGWENDNVQFNNPDYRGGANKESLNEARAKFKTKKQ